jgi:metal-responsive CopG/Arc/MetJ family transcriptional regulator
MKAVQVVFDEETLRELDASAEVQREGRSALLRRLAQEHLRQAKQREIDALYQKAYGEGGGLGEEWQGWEEEAAWPSE